VPDPTSPKTYRIRRGGSYPRAVGLVNGRPDEKSATSGFYVSEELMGAPRGNIRSLA